MTQSASISKQILWGFNWTPHMVKPLSPGYGFGGDGSGAVLDETSKVRTGSLEDQRLIEK